MHLAAAAFIHFSLNRTPALTERILLKQILLIQPGRRDLALRQALAVSSRANASF